MLAEMPLASRSHDGTHLSDMFDDLFDYVGVSSHLAEVGFLLRVQPLIAMRGCGEVGATAAARWLG